MNRKRKGSALLSNVIIRALLVVSLKKRVSVANWTLFTQTCLTTLALRHALPEDTQTLTLNARCVMVLARPVKTLLLTALSARIH